MSARVQTVPPIELASLRFWRWGLWHDKRWQKTSLWSAFIWVLNFCVLLVGITEWGHGWWILIGQNLFWDGVTFIVNKKKFWGDRKVSYVSSGSFTFVASLFFTLSHKAMLLFMATVLGMGVVWVQIALAGFGVLENPVRYLFNNHFAFAEVPQQTDKA